MLKKYKNMSKIFNYYSNNIDYTWYESSNIKYSECIDNENELKKLKVTFNNGSTYQYDNVHVNDYLLFRENASQGKALNTYIKSKQYPYTKIESKDLNLLNEELQFRQSSGVFIIISQDETIIKDCFDKIIYQSNRKITENEIEMISQTLTGLGHKISIKNNTNGNNN